MAVARDSKIEDLRACLPGANCGACGYPGCDAYAEALAQDAPGNLCTPGGTAAAQAIAQLRGGEADAVEKKRACVHCGGTKTLCQISHEYVGESTCAASSLLYSGQKMCNYGCLGFGDCAKVCPAGAIQIREGLAVIDRKKCAGCALCVAACPKNLIDLQPDAAIALNRCANRAPGAVSRKQCGASCLGCRLCVKNCPVGAVTVEDNLARVNPALCTACGACVKVCPTGCLALTH
jgi:Na+-translocating ferredoxin:NAD+ oxidoreductase RNF subunit RnfB